MHCEEGVSRILQYQLHITAASEICFQTNTSLRVSVLRYVCSESTVMAFTSPCTFAAAVNPRKHTFRSSMSSQIHETNITMLCIHLKVTEILH